MKKDYAMLLAFAVIVIGLYALSRRNQGQGTSLAAELVGKRILLPFIGGYNDNGCSPTLVYDLTDNLLSGVIQIRSRFIQK